MEHLNNQKLYNSKEVRELLGNISTTTLWRYLKKGLLHKPLQPSPKQNFWKSEWIDDFIAKLEAKQEVA